MTLTSLPLISLAADPATLPDALGGSFREFGFAMVEDHGIEPALIDAAWRLTAEFFALPESEKLTYFRPDLAGARGYTPFGREIAKGAKVSDLKEFWHVGRGVSADPGPIDPAMHPNIWPQRPAGFREVFTELFDQFDRVGAVLLSHIAVHLGLPADRFVADTAGGVSLLRLLHYPPLSHEPGLAMRAEAHEDINLITLLLGAEESGLELLARDGSWIAVTPPAGALVINIGDMLQRLTNHVLPSTTHRVRNPEKVRSGFSRYSMPFFVHLRGDVRLAPLPGCVTTENPLRDPHTVTADEYLHERLREIGLLS
ncbi:MAG TPA: 2-oxoglutarate and iron-dependent oxygenase domain-containing protein [Novosphingobium sp.]|nr:2-oxoglutarate and iron-dependent oxygenase domain-containing protein [Novosphingobium sp.]